MKRGIMWQFDQEIKLLNTPLTFSNTRNKFTALGCDNLAFMNDADGGFGGGCFSFCGHNKSSSDDGSCSGFGCCQTPIPKHLKTLNMTIEKVNSTSDYSRTGISCSYAFLTDPTLYNILDIDLFTNPTDLLEDDQYPRPPVVLDWVVGKDKCEASEGPLGYACGETLPELCAPTLTMATDIVAYVWKDISETHTTPKDAKRRRREKNFIKHGGSVLENQRVRIFKEEELIKATQNYNHLLGQGGFGSVYKGVLLDKTIIAVKKPRVDKKNLNIEFQHEIRIISQVNHKNVVKLLGLCLHTDVPFLVYEYISNGTLYDLLHKTGSSFLRSWKNCLKIAEETASALNYLHSSADPPIIHRDVKSANILLDEHHTAKVSDFGASVLIPTGQNGIATTAQGTPGYLDPEYLTTGNLTAKSDVYSFGVVLVELLTGHNPCTFTRFGKRSNLIQYFNSSLQDNNLFQILNVEAVDRIEREQIQEIANLAMNCMNSCGEKRPTMMEVAEVLGKLMRVSQANFLVQHNREETESLAGDFDLLLPSRGFENATSLMGCQLSESHLSESSSILNSDVSTV
uniref:Protein kinase domain-containing protein n=1 Tax=Fagus sylvatica TaxID=28930 RepID=A0A2N9IBK4_FAGSY